MNPEDILSSSDVLKKIETVCKRHFSTDNDVNECFIFVIDSLRSQDYKRLRAFKGNSKLTTYLYTLVNSLVIDFRRKKFGRRRIPAPVRKLGQWAEVVYRLICWQRFSVDDAFGFLQVDGLYEGSYDRFRQQIIPIQNAPCRRNPSYQSIDNPESSASHLSDTRSNPMDTLLEKLDLARRVRAAGIIRNITQELSEKDQLLVRLVYGSDHSVRAAAAAVGLSTTAVRNRLKRLLSLYRERLLAEGIREP
jgi:RNA polymerase sigma factor (sigma-70 family)